MIRPTATWRPTASTVAMRGNSAGGTMAKQLQLVICLTVALIFSDQNLLAPNLSQAAKDLQLTDVERDEKLGGGLALGLFVVGGSASMLVGAAADGWIRRVDLLALVLGIGGCGCLGSAFSPSYFLLFVSRAVTGIGLGGALPLTFSLIGDAFPPADRTAVSGRIGMAMSIGTCTGQILAGALGPRLGWRTPFVLIGSVMVLFALIVQRLMSEPARRVRDQPGWRASVRDWGAILRIPTVWLVFLQGLPGCVPWGVIGTFLPDYLHANCGYSVTEASVVMTFFSLGGFCGTTIGGELGQRLYNHSAWRPAVLMLTAGSAGVLPMRFLIMQTPSSRGTACALAALGGLLATVTGPNIRATLANVTSSKQRGVAFAMFALFDDVGKGAGPAAVAWLVRSIGRRRAFAIAMLGWLPCAVLCGATALSVVADEARSSKREEGSGDDCEPLLALPGLQSAQHTLRTGSGSAGTKWV